MNIFNAIASGCSIIGLILTIWTLSVTYGTRKALKNYKFQVDCKEQLNVLKGTAESTGRDNLPFDHTMIYNCTYAAKRLRVLWGEQIGTDLHNKLLHLEKIFMSLEDNLQDDSLQRAANAELTDAAILIEKELSL